MTDYRFDRLRWTARSAWGAWPARWGTIRSLDEVQGLAVHYSTGEELGVTDTAAWVRRIQAYHMDTRGWSDIAYNALVDREGRMFEGRSIFVAGAHSTGTWRGRPANRALLSICMLGDDDPGYTELNPAVRAAIVFYLRAVAITMGPGSLPAIVPHRALKATACPGDEITDWIAAGMRP